MVATDTMKGGLLSPILCVWRGHREGPRTIVAFSAHLKPDRQIPSGKLQLLDTANRIRHFPDFSKMLRICRLGIERLLTCNCIIFGHKVAIAMPVSIFLFTSSYFGSHFTVLFDTFMSGSDKPDNLSRCLTDAFIAYEQASICNDDKLTLACLLHFHWQSCRNRQPFALYPVSSCPPYTLAFGHLAPTFQTNKRYVFQYICLVIPS